MDGILDFNQLQHEHKEWSVHNFPGQTPEEIILKLGEETGELMGAYTHLIREYRGNKKRWEMEIEDAVGDITIVLAGICSILGIDYQVTVEKVWKDVKQRDWIKYPMNGISEQIKEIDEQKQLERA